MPTLVQANASVDPTVAATTVSVTITAGGNGNNIEGMVAWQDATTTLVSVKDNNGVNYNILDTLVDPTNTTSGASFYKENISGAPTSIIATLSGSQLARIQINEWSGIATTTPLDGHNATVSTGTTVTSSNFTPTVNGDLIYGATTVSSVAGATLTAGSGFTKRNSFDGAGVIQIADDETQIQGTAGAIATTFVSGGGSLTALVFGMAFKAAAGGVIDVPAGFKGGYWPSRWTRNAFLLHHRRSGPEASSAVETNTHFIPRAFPRQWSLNSFLLHNRRAGPEASSAVETNTHWQGRTWKSQWNINDSPNLLWNSTGDVFAAIASDNPTYFIPRSWPLRWSLQKALQQSTAQDFSSSAVETNPHWRGGSWPVQWTLSPALWRTIPQDFGSSAVETNPYWAGKPWPITWNLNRALGQVTAQDFSSSVVETNVHFISHPWPVQWLLTRALWQNLATDAQVVVTAPDVPTYFTPVQFPWQWTINLLLTTSPANDLTSPAVETNPHWAGRTYPRQWQTLPFLWQIPATDAPIVVSAAETNTYFVPHQFPARWDINRLLNKNTAQDFSSFAVDTPVNFVPTQFPWQWVINLLLTTSPANDLTSPITPVFTGIEWYIRYRRRGR